MKKQRRSLPSTYFALSPIWQESLPVRLLRGGVLDMMRVVRYTWRFFLVFTLVAVITALFSDSVFAATYYLNPASGNDENSGTQGSPWKTMQKVKTTVAAGDTVNVMGGTYTPAQYLLGGDFYWTESQ